jgi:hypothetical protein
MADLPDPEAAKENLAPKPAVAQLDPHKTEAQSALNGGMPAKSPGEAALNGQTAPATAAQPQQPNFKQDAQGFLTEMSMLAGLMGVMGRGHATSALNAFGSAMQGYKQGEMQSANEEYKKWKASTDATLKANKTQLQRYNGILKATNLTAEQKLAQLQLAATEHQDKIMADQAAARNLQAVDVAIQQRAKVGEHLEKSSAKIDQWKKGLDQHLAKQKPGSGYQGDDKRKSLPKMDLFDGGMEGEGGQPGAT